MKKLKLNKEIVTKLDTISMSDIKGGKFTDSIAINVKRSNRLQGKGENCRASELHPSYQQNQGCQL